MIKIESERLILRRFNKEDWLDIYEYLSDPEVVKYEPYNPMSQDECKKEAFNRSLNEAFIAVCMKDTGKVIGNLYFKKQDPADFMTWELGYVFNTAYQGHGYATEASKRIIQYAFEELSAHKIIARCNPQNERSWMLMERIGMVREGTFRKPAFFKRDSSNNPIWHDAYQYGVLDEDWNE